MTAEQIRQVLEDVVRNVMKQELDGLRAQIELLHQRLDSIAPRTPATAVAKAESLGDIERRVRLNALDEIRTAYLLWTDGGASEQPVGDRQAARRIGEALRRAGLSAPEQSPAHHRDAPIAEPSV